MEAARAGGVTIIVRSIDAIEGGLQPARVPQLSVLASDVYRPDQWRDFFMTVGGGAAALTGLVFVAMSLNLEVITRDATHRYRAIGTLAGFAAVFVTCALVTMGGQDHVAVGIEWAVVAGFGTVFYVAGYVRAVRMGGSALWLRRYRLIGGTALYLTEVLGAAVLTVGRVEGLYAAAVAMVALVAFLISGAWLLIVGASGPRVDVAEGRGSDQAPDR